MEQDQFTSLLDLPNEVIEEIVSYLPAFAVRKNLRLTCKRLHDVCNCARFCQNEVIVWSKMSEPHMISTFRNSTRGSYNLEFNYVKLKHELVTEFFEQHGAKICELTFISCKSPPGLLEMMITRCEALCSLRIDVFQTSNFPSIDPTIVTRPTVTLLQLRIDVKMLRQSPSVFHQISSIFPCVKHLKIQIEKNYRKSMNFSDSIILDFIMNFRHLESLELNTSLNAFLEKGPAFLDSLPKLKKLQLSFDWGSHESQRLWKRFASRLKVSSIDRLQLHCLDLIDIEPLLRVTGLSRLSLCFVDSLNLSLETFKAFVTSQLKMITIEADELLIYPDLTKDFRIEPNKTVTDLIFQPDPIQSKDQSLIMTLFSTHFHGLVHLHLGRVSDEVIQSIFKYQKNLRSLILADCKKCSMNGFCGTADGSFRNSIFRNSIRNLQNLEHLTIENVQEYIVQSRTFQKAFDFPRLKYLHIQVYRRSSKRHKSSRRNNSRNKSEVPVNMFKPCVSLEALSLGNFTVPSSVIVSSLLQNSKNLNYLNFYNLDDDDDFRALTYVNLKHFYWIDSEKLLMNCSPEKFYYDEVLDRTVFTQNFDKHITLHSPKISCNKIYWITIN